MKKSGMREEIKDWSLTQPLTEDRQGEIYADTLEKDSSQKSYYIESYGCAMNFSDSEIVASILQQEGFGSTSSIYEADLILINTCSIREKAEDNVRQRLREFDKVKEENPGTLVGVLGCMAERLKTKLLEEEKLVDLVVGPDAYRDLPMLIRTAEDGDKGVNVFLSREETYADISPVRLDSNGVTAFISIMRGCDNMCSFCVVPFTRGRERSRDPFSIVAEASDLYQKGYREVTLLGQNVDSFRWTSPDGEHAVSFAELLTMVADVHPDLRVRFSTSHPKDITDDVLYAIRDYENICNYIHLPVQSGNSRILQLMNRTYDRDWYQEKVRRIYEIVPDCAISSDMIAGFCSETEEEHRDTLSMMDFARYSMSYMFYYSERPGTVAERKYEDDIPLEVKKRRLSEIIQRQQEISREHNQHDLGKTYKVLIEGDSKKSPDDFKGRNSQNKMIVFPKIAGYKPGDYVQVQINDASSATLLGNIMSV
ncbi:MAG TPA: tRNA (N6-isopentenyl adenosine(37)-C2)-methylthiotransferase MiaB [Membranihabitans sp.]|nr:tRNA (N6-isopentenyl adenosine(37)-C2)-methylthiotransferase MiaB [Membranihabitans sp.]